MYRRVAPTMTSMFVVVLCCGCTSGPALNDGDAGGGGNGRGNSSSDLRERVERLDQMAGRVPPSMRSGIVIVQRNVELTCGRFEFVRTESRTLFVYDADESGDLVQEVEIAAGEIRFAEAWHARADGTIRRLDRSAFTLHEGAAGRRHARVRFEELRAGDRVGFTVTAREGQGLAHLREPLAFDQYVLSGRLRIGGDALLTHRVAARNVGDLDVSVEVTERRRGFPHRITVTYGGLPPRRSAAFDLPPLLREPHLDIVRHGRFYQELDAWLLSNDWDVWIALELGQPSSWVSTSSAVTAMAERIAVDARTDREIADALYRFVRDTIVTTDPTPDEQLLGDPHLAINLDLAQMERDLDEEVDSPLAQRFRDAQQLPPAEAKWSSPRRLGPARSPEAVLLAGEGTRLEKTALLASLFASMHLEQRIALARDRSFGPHDHESTGRWQFTDAFVVLLTPDLLPDLWYCPTRDDLPPGVLPVGLQNVSMLTVRDAFEEELEAAWLRARTSVGARIELRVAAWLRFARAAQWARWTPTPGNPNDPAGALEETTRWSTDGSPSRSTVRTSGEADVDPQTYLRLRYPTAVELEIPRRSDPAGLDHRGNEFEVALELPALPDPDESTWRLSGPMIFGTGPLQAWSRESTIFHVDRTLDHLWRLELPLPAGWSALVPVPELVQQNERLHYVARVGTAEGRVVLERRLRLDAGTSTGADVRDALENIRLFEEGWLVLRRAGSARD